MSALTNRRVNLITDFFRPNTPDPRVDRLPPPDPIIDLTVPSADEAKETKLTNRNKFHRYRNNPTPRLTTLNTTSYSNMPTDKKGFKRQVKIIKNLETVASHSDFVLTQESKTESKSPIYRRLLRPQFKSYRNPNIQDPSRAGTDIFAAERMLKGCDDIHDILVEGHIQALTLIPISDESIFLVPYTIFNVYLPSGNDSTTNALRASMLKKLQDYTPPSNPKHIFAAGDWNLTEFRSDSSSKDHFASSSAARQALQQALDAHGLKEVYQPAHTCIRAGGQKTSSRIDRIYISHSLPEKCLMSPETTLPYHPYLPGEGKNKGPTEHYPVSLHFYPPNLSKGTRFKIPEWIAIHPNFHTKVLSAWATTPRTPSKPGKNWLAFKKVIKTVARELMKDLHDSAHNKATSLTISISVYRGLQGSFIRKSTATSLAAQSPDLKTALEKDLSNNDTSLSKVASHIDLLFKRNPTLTPLSKRPNLLRQAKNTLPCGKRFLSHLVKDNGERVDNSQDMAKLLETQWSPVWNRPNPPPLVVDEYITHYDKNTNGDQPDITVDHFHAVMN